MIDENRLDSLVNFLNELVEVDKEAVKTLINCRVPCNQKMADHKTVQVLDENGFFSVGVLGLLNGYIGVYDESNWGSLAAFFDDTGELINFGAIGVKNGR